MPNKPLVSSHKLIFICGLPAFYTWARKMGFIYVNVTYVNVTYAKLIIMIVKIVIFSRDANRTISGWNHTGPKPGPAFK